MHNPHPILHLIKYDLKFIYKQLAIFYIIIFVLAITARLTNFDNSPFIIRFIHEFAQGAAFGFSIGMIINGGLRDWAKFKYSMYGDESYLSHTLPIKRSTLWNAKFLTSIIVIALSILTFIACIFIMFLSSENLALLDSFGDNVWITICIFIATIFCQFTFIMQAGLTGIILGHRHNNNRMVYSVIYGIILYLVVGLSIIGFCLLFSLFVPSLRAMIVDGTFSSLQDANLLLSIINIMYIIAIITSYFINRNALQHGVNVD